MPLDAWVLLFFAVGLGLALEVAFYSARRRGGPSGDGADTGAPGEHQGAPDDGTRSDGGPGGSGGAP